MYIITVIEAPSMSLMGESTDQQALLTSFEVHSTVADGTLPNSIVPDDHLPHQAGVSVPDSSSDSQV